jgi:hypothetical protein
MLAVGVAVRVGVAVEVAVEVGVEVSVRVKVGVVVGETAASPPPPAPQEVSNNEVRSRNHKAFLIMKVLYSNPLSKTTTKCRFHWSNNRTTAGKRGNLHNRLRLLPERETGL